MTAPAWHYFSIVPGDPKRWNEQTCEDWVFEARREFLTDTDNEQYYDLVINTDRFVVYKFKGPGAPGTEGFHFYIRSDLLA